MKKNIIISTDFFDPKKYSNAFDFIECLEKNKHLFRFYIISKTRNIATAIVNYLNGMGIDSVAITRNTREIAASLHYECIFGNKDVDFFLATHSKKIIFYDNNIECEHRVIEYGLSFDIDILDNILKIIDFSSCNDLYANQKIIFNTTLVALINAKSKYGYITDEEKNFINLLQKFLKADEVPDKRTCYLFVIYLLLQLQKANLPKPDYIFYYPSSSGRENPIMREITKILRNIFHLKIEQKELMKRTIAVTPSKELNYDDRVSCKRHFNSISINEEYDINNKNVWILDDYFTNGTSFETTRNLLKKQNFKSLSLISIGAFGKNYIYQDYDSQNRLIKSDYITINYLDTYRDIVDKLIEIINK